MTSKSAKNAAVGNDSGSIRNRSAKQRLTLKKKLAFAGLATAGFFLLLEGLLLLCGVEPAHVRDDPYAGFVAHIPHFVPAEADDGTELLAVAPSKSEVMNEITFAPNKTANTFRIVCLGGSTTYGRPFFDKTSIAGWLREFLPAADPSKNWEVINAGALSYASYRVAGVMQELAQYQPDLFIIYTGHNEFLERRTYEKLLQQSPWLRDSLSWASHSRTMTVIRGTLEQAGLARDRPSRSPALPGEVKRIPIDIVGPEAYHRDETFRRQVIKHFRVMLERMLDLAEEAGAKVVLVIPASNSGDFVPFKSEHKVGLSAEDASRWQTLYAHALELTQQRRLEQALTVLQEAQSIDNRRADLHFAQGQLLMALKRYPEAAQAFQRALQEDICPLRAIDELVQVIRTIGKSRGAILVDFADLVAQRCDHQIPNRKMFHDHVHPTMAASRLLALEILDRLAAEGLVTFTAGWDAETLGRITSKLESSIDRPLYARQLVALSTLLTKLGQTGMGRVQALAAFELSGRSVDIGIAVSRLLLQLKAQALAVNVMRQVVENQPDSAPARCQLGMVLLANQQVDAALEQMDAAIQLDPDLAEAHHFAGLLRTQKGLMSEAEQHFKHAVRLNPEWAAAHDNLALSIAQQGRHAEALPYYQRALELNPNSSNTHHNMALALQALGRDAQAKKHFEESKRLED